MRGLIGSATLSSFVTTKRPSQKHTMTKLNMQNVPHNQHQQQGIVVTNQSDKDDVFCSTSNQDRAPDQDYWYALSEVRKTTKSMARSQQEGITNQDRRHDDALDPIPEQDYAESERVAAGVDKASPFAEAGTVSTHEDTSFSVLQACAVDEDCIPLPAGPIVEAILLETFKPRESMHHEDALLKRRKHRFVSALTRAFVASVIVAVLLLTQKGSNAAPGGTTYIGNQSASHIFLAELKPFLSDKSLTALTDPISPQNQSLQWLLERSNFQDWIFQQQVQRYAMATIYHATGHRWSDMV